MKEDYLFKAAAALKSAKLAVKNKEYNSAWAYLHEQKDFYMKHCIKFKFSPQDTNALDANVHEELANILRIEGKHRDAFLDILYWVIAQQHRPKKAHKSKLLAYYNRCNFKYLTYSEVIKFVKTKHQNTHYFTSLNIFNEWLENEKTNLK